MQSSQNIGEPCTYNCESNSPGFVHHGEGFRLVGEPVVFSFTAIGGITVEITYNIGGTYISDYQMNPTSSSLNRTAGIENSLVPFTIYFIEPGPVRVTINAKVEMMESPELIDVNGSFDFVVVAPNVINSAQQFQPLTASFNSTTNMVEFAKGRAVAGQEGMNLQATVELPTNPGIDPTWGAGSLQWVQVVSNPYNIYSGSSVVLSTDNGSLELDEKLDNDLPYKSEGEHLTGAIVQVSVTDSPKFTVAITGNDGTTGITKVNYTFMAQMFLMYKPNVPSDRNAIWVALGHLAWSNNYSAIATSSDRKSWNIIQQSNNQNEAYRSSGTIPRYTGRAANTSVDGSQYGSNTATSSINILNFQGISMGYSDDYIGCANQEGLWLIRDHNDLIFFEISIPPIPDSKSDPEFRFGVSMDIYNPSENAASGVPFTISLNGQTEPDHSLTLNSGPNENTSFDLNKNNASTTDSNIVRFTMNKSFGTDMVVNNFGMYAVL